MAKPIITIIGLGLTGTSLGLALQRGETNFEIVGHDKNPEAGQNAKRINAVHRSEWNLHRACDKAELILLTTPLSEIDAILGPLSEDVGPNTLIIAMGGLLQPILEAAARYNVVKNRLVAGRPVLPSIGAIHTAHANLFDESVFALATGAETDAAALELASGFLSRIGAQPLFVDAQEHDGIAASVDQLPQLLAVVLMAMQQESPSWREAQRLAGRSFAQSTEMGVHAAAIASGLRTNRQQILHSVDRLQAALTEWRTLLQSEPSEKGEDRLVKEIDKAIDARILWGENVKLRRWDVDAPAASMPERNSGGFFRQMLFGGMGRQPNETKNKK